MTPRTHSRPQRPQRPQRPRDTQRTRLYHWEDTLFHNTPHAIILSHSHTISLISTIFSHFHQCSIHLTFLSSPSSHCYAHGTRSISLTPSGRKPYIIIHEAAHILISRMASPMFHYPSILPSSFHLSEPSHGPSFLSTYLLLLSQFLPPSPLLSLDIDIDLLSRSALAHRLRFSPISHTQSLLNDFLSISRSKAPQSPPKHPGGSCRARCF